MDEPTADEKDKALQVLAELAGRNLTRGTIKELIRHLEYLANG